MMPKLKVTLTKTNIFFRLKNVFVEGEAELSGSDDDLSDDEDEKELDKLEMEEGDLDDIDEDQVRSEVSHIFSRRVLLYLDVLFSASIKCLLCR